MSKTIRTTLAIGLVTVLAGAPALAAVADDGRSAARERLAAHRASSGPLEPSHRLSGDGVDGDTAAAVARALAARTGGANPRPAGPDVAPDTQPVFTAPASGATVSGEVTVTVESSAPVVRFALQPAAAWEREAPVTDGLATATLDTFGLDGAVTLTASDCSEAAECGTPSTLSVSVDNGPVTLTQPSDGQVVGTSFVASAERSGGAVRFLVDDEVRGTATSAPYQAMIDTTDLSEGQHQVQAVGCSADLQLCSGGVSAVAVVEVDTALSPQITSVRPELISPNRDGRRDKATVSYWLDVPQEVRWSVVDSFGATVRPAGSAVSKPAGSHTSTLTGRRADGTPLPDGAYTLVLETSRDLGGSTVTGRAEAGFTVDTTAPAARSTVVRPRTFFPVKDGYRDTATLRGVLSERVTSLVVEVVDRDGRRVRTIDKGSHAAGSVRVAWNGRDRKGALVRPGRYELRFRLGDAAGNRSTSPLRAVSVSHKRLVKYSGSQTVRPKASIVGAIIGSCSEVGYPARKAWPGSFVYLSNYHVCWDPTPQQLLATTAHAVTLPRAFAYPSIRVDTYGARSVPGFPDVGVVLYFKRSGDLSDKGALLRAKQKWHDGDRVRGDRYVTKKRRFRWLAGTTDGMYYDVKSFKVRYSYQRLE